MRTHTHTISRASKALKEGAASSSHERLLTTVWCQQAFERVEHNLNSLTNTKDLKLDSSISDLAKEIIGHGGTVPVHPLGV